MTAKGLSIFCNALMLLMMSSSCGAAKPDAVNTDEPQRDVANEAIFQIPTGTIRTLEGILLANPHHARSTPAKQLRA